MNRLNYQFLRSTVPITLGAGLFGLGLYALYHLLKPVNPTDVVAHIRATPASEPWGSTKLMMQKAAPLLAPQI
ncbi:MAG: hypothetical protein KDE17_14965 [Rhodobacteraceae bacterium]|nr:hypothetical protein [Paracoccaceae bacterium]